MYFVWHCKSPFPSCISVTVIWLSAAGSIVVCVRRIVLDACRKGNRDTRGRFEYSWPAIPFSFKLGRSLMDYYHGTQGLHEFTWLALLSSNWRWKWLPELYNNETHDAVIIVILREGPCRHLWMALEMVYIDGTRSSQYQHPVPFRFPSSESLFTTGTGTWIEERTLPRRRPVESLLQSRGTREWEQRTPRDYMFNNWK